jgi:hypothetical protein
VSPSSERKAREITYWVCAFVGTNVSHCEMGGACGTYRGGERGAQGVGRET